MTTSTRDIVLRMEGKLDSALVQLEDHDNDLNGNGKPGLKSDFRDIKTTVEGLVKCQEKKDDFGNQVKLLAVGEVLTLVGLAIALFFRLK